jgi:hypothetical protein
MLAKDSAIAGGRISGERRRERDTSSARPMSRNGASQPQRVAWSVNMAHPGRPAPAAPLALAVAIAVCLALALGSVTAVAR